MLGPFFRSMWDQVQVFWKPSTLFSMAWNTQCTSVWCMMNFMTEAFQCDLKIVCTVWSLCLFVIWSTKMSWNLQILVSIYWYSQTKEIISFVSYYCCCNPSTAGMFETKCSIVNEWYEQFSRKIWNLTFILLDQITFTPFFYTSWKFFWLDTCETTSETKCYKTIFSNFGIKTFKGKQMGRYVMVSLLWVLIN